MSDVEPIDIPKSWHAINSAIHAHEMATDFYKHYDRYNRNPTRIKPFCTPATEYLKSNGFIVINKSDLYLIEWGNYTAYSEQSFLDALEKWIEKARELSRSSVFDIGSPE